MTDAMSDLAGLAIGADDLLRAVLDTTAEPMWVVDGDGRIRFASPAAVRALGYDGADELLGRDAHATFHRRADGTPCDAADCGLLRPPATGERVRGELDWLSRRDGSVLPVSYTSAPLELRDGRGAVVAFADLSLHRLATPASGGSAAEEVFAAVAREVACSLRLPAVWIGRYEADGTATVVGAWGQGAPTRLPDARAAPTGPRAPIVVDGRVWGVIGTWAPDDAPLPDGVEDRLAHVARLLAPIFSDRATRDEIARLGDAQAALRRVATLVARQASPAEVFNAVAEEVAAVVAAGAIGMLRFDPDATAVLVAQSATAWPPPPVGTRFALDGDNAVTAVHRHGRPTRSDDWASATGVLAEAARSLGIRSTVAAPIVVEGQLWGTMVAASSEPEPLPPDTESRLGELTELVATAIANAEARTEVSRLAEEQAALRRVATLVAQEAPPDQLLGKVAEEVCTVLGPRLDSAILRFDAGETATVVAVWGQQPRGGIRVGARIPIDGSGVTARVFRERRAVRVDHYLGAAGAIAERAHEHGILAAVGCPIFVHGGLWGAMVVAHYRPEPFPADTELRVAQFTELVATAIANTEARTEVRRLAEEQAALRRVATLVAQGVAPAEVFDAVVLEVANLLGAAQVGLMRWDGADEITILAHRGQDPELVRAGLRLPLDGDSVTARVLRTGASARLNAYDPTGGAIADIAQRSNVNVTVGAPIVVEGALWGVITASWTGDDPPDDHAEERLAQFAELVDTAIANAAGRDQLMASRVRVLTAGDEARRRVVRDLHDGAQQRLIHTIVTLQLARRALREDPERVDALLAEALDHAEHGNAELRELAHGILPSLLTRGGLSAAVDGLVARLDLPVDVAVPAVRLPVEVEASAYFIVAEALTNVTKHARATHAAVTAALGEGTLTIEVRDDGVGGADPQGHGLLGMGDRVAALGGGLRIDSPRGAGTVVAAELPVR
jgi:PAS domain S-box-containing protein